MSIDWNWGIFLQQAPFGNTTYGLAVERFSNHRRPLHLGLDHRFSRRLTVRHFTHGTQSLPLGHWHLLCRTVSQRAADRAVLYGTWWCRSSCRKISACGLNRSWTQTFNSLSPPCCAGAVYRRSRLRAGTRRHPVAAARAEERRRRWA